MSSLHRSLIVSLLCALAMCGGRAVGQETVQVGAGSYLAGPPEGAKRPPATIYRTSRVTGPVPTSDWWSSLAWLPFSERHYPHPLAVQCEAGGLRVHYPGPSITANESAIFGFMPPGGRDLVLGLSASGNGEADAFPDARLDGHSDWFVTAAFIDGERALRVSYGHGSPYVYATYEGGDPRITLAEPCKVWAGDANGPTLGITIGKNHYGLFAPRGATWSGLDGKRLDCRSGERRYFSLAVLPEASREVLDLFARHAHVHVTGTRVTPRYDAATSRVETRFDFELDAREGDGSETLFALYPHQWRLTGQELLPQTYDSVRGTMKLARGSGFTTSTPFPGVLPTLPEPADWDRPRVAAWLEREVAAPPPGPRDTYAEGKWLGRLATQIPIAAQAGRPEIAAKLRGRVRQRLEHWLTAGDGRPGFFWYEPEWGALVGHPASFGSDAELNDHHFHYGYFLRAAAEIAADDPAWGRNENWGGMVRVVADDIAAPRRDDPRFPFLRCFDPYAGHSWASGHARFGDGNNNESSSEAMQAWCGLILWGEATGDTRLRDLGIYLFATELAAIEAYWFDVEGQNFPEGYTPSCVTMVWGGKGANATWFSANPELVHGINWLPLHGGSLYLGRYPKYVRKNYDALLRENGGPQWDDWADIVWMYRGLDDPADAMAQFEAGHAKAPLENGNSPANAYHWLANLARLGQVDRGVTADHPLHAVFRQGDRRTYVAYQMQETPRKITFSDGTVVEATGRGFAVRTSE